MTLLCNRAKNLELGIWDKSQQYEIYYITNMYKLDN